MVISCAKIGAMDVGEGEISRNEILVDAAMRNTRLALGKATWNAHQVNNLR